MANSKLLAITVERFKSHASETRIDFGLLNVIIGRNNSGKSSVIQALLLLKQTLEFPRLDVPLRLEGYVDAYSIRELTYGWPEPEQLFVRGPTFRVEWESTIDVKRALAELGDPEIITLSEKGRLPWLLHAYVKGELYPKSTKNIITLHYGELLGKTVLSSVVLESEIVFGDQIHRSLFRVERDNDGSTICFFGDEVARQLVISMEHFIPFVSIDRRNVGPRDRQRSWSNAFHILFLESLEDLKGLIKGFSFLSSTRVLPPSLYSPSTEPIDNIGVSGELAAQLLQSHQSDYVHYLLPRAGQLPEYRERTLATAVNEVLAVIGIEGEVSIDEIKNAGFRLMFGKASLQHVGRGLTYLLPLIQLGLVSDPLRFKYHPSITADQYAKLGYVLCAFEEPEAHLHPKVQSGLAEWFVALAMGRRQVVVETHSDHLVRKLRSLVAVSEQGSVMEQWLLRNVRIFGVEQKDGISSLSSSSLTRDGGVEHWPTDFMDQSSEIEQQIYLASFDKSPDVPEPASKNYIHNELEREIERNP